MVFRWGGSSRRGLNDGGRPPRGVELAWLWVWVWVSRTGKEVEAEAVRFEGRWEQRKRWNCGVTELEDVVKEDHGASRYFYLTTHLLVLSGQQKQDNQIRGMGTRIKSTKRTSPEQRTQSFVSQVCMKCMNPRSRSLGTGVCVCMSLILP